MIDKLFKRKHQLDDIIDETFTLLNELQRKLITADNPLEVNRLRRDIQRLRETSEEFCLEWMSIEKLIRKYQEQLQGNEILPEPANKEGKSNAG